MSLSEILLASAAILSSLGAVGAVFYKRRQPELDNATAAHQLVSSNAVKTEIERASRQLNAQRDLRVLDLETWADLMRPWTREVRDKFDRLFEMLRDERWSAGKDMPEIHLPDPPEFPPPRPV